MIKIILLLLLVFVLLVSGCSNQSSTNAPDFASKQSLVPTESHIPNENTAAPSPTQSPIEESTETMQPLISEQPKVFKTSESLSEITLSRNIDVPFNVQTKTGSIKATANFKLSGYLKEVDSDYSAKKTFKLDGGRLEWSINAESINPQTKCTNVVKVTGSGSDDISNLNIFYEERDGQATSINGSRITNGDYDLKIKYSDSTLSGKKELTVVGKLLVPVSAVESSVPTGSQPCSDVYESNLKRSSQLTFPITLYDLDPSQNGSQSGTFLGREPIENELKGSILSGYSDAEFAGHLNIVFSWSSATSQLVILGDAGDPWTVSWKLEFPH